MAVTWDPTQYARFADERSRPFLDLIARIGATAPTSVVDLGCGDGPLTATLAQRWPQALVVGVDSSAEMLDRARQLSARANRTDPTARIHWQRADLATWAPASLGAAPEVIVTNAALQWVPGHERLMLDWVAALAPDGWYAMQVPGNLDAPSHRLMREAANGHPRRESILRALDRGIAARTAQDYLELLVGATDPDGNPLSLDLDAWETTYLHVLPITEGARHPVLEWVSGTGLRPALAASPDEQDRASYLEAYERALDAAYPRRDFGVVLPFTRRFLVAHRPGPDTRGAQESTVG